MSDRLAEIRARLDARTSTMPGSNERMVWDSGRSYHVEDDRDRATQEFHQHAPADIAWLLAENEALREQIGFLRDDVERVRGYASHRDECAAIADGEMVYDWLCDCGLEVGDA